MAQRRRKERPQVEAPTLVLDAEVGPFTTGGNVEAGIYQVANLGPRIIATSRNSSAQIVEPRSTTCVHRKPIRPAPAKFGGFDTAGADARERFAALCRLCEYEADVLRRRKP